MRGDSRTKLSVKVPHQLISFAIEDPNNPNNGMFCDIDDVTVGPYWGDQWHPIQKTTFDILESVLAKFAKNFFKHDITKLHCAHFRSHTGKLAIQDLSKVECITLKCVDSSSKFEIKKRFERNRMGQWTMPRDMAWGDMFRFLHILSSNSTFASKLDRQPTSFDESWADIRLIESSSQEQDVDCWVEMKFTDEIALVSLLGGEDKYAFAKVPASCEEKKRVPYCPEIPILEDLAFAITIALAICKIWDEQSILMPEKSRSCVDVLGDLFYLDDSSQESIDDANLKRMLVDEELSSAFKKGHDLFENKGVVNFGEAQIHVEESGVSIKKGNKNTTPWMTIEGLRSLVWLLLGSNAAKGISVGTFYPGFNSLYEASWKRVEGPMPEESEKKALPPTILPLNSTAYADELTNSIMEGMQTQFATCLETALREVI